MVLLVLILCAISFYVGVLFGGHDMKKAYGIPRECGVDEFKNTYIRVDSVEDCADDGNIDS